MIATIVRIWPGLCRLLIFLGAANALLAAIWWLCGMDSTFHNFFVFIGMVAFLLGAKAQDDVS